MMKIQSFFPMLGLLLSACGNAPDPQQQAEALLGVAELGDISAIERLLGEQTDVNARNSCDWTPLMKAAVNGHSEAVARLLDAGAEVDAVDQGGYTALLLAASNNHVEVVEQLLARGAMIDAQEQTQGYTPLIWAAHRGHRAAVERLLAHGADPTLPDFEAETAADHARRGGHAEILGLLGAASRGRLATNRTQD
jgi:ankyrin repeat protein